MWLQRGSEATITDAGEVFGLGASPGHLALLTFCCGNTKRGRIHLIGSLCSTGWRMAGALAADWAF